MSSYELRLPPDLPYSPLADYCFALAALSFEYSSKGSSDYFSSPDPGNCCLQTILLLLLLIVPSYVLGMFQCHLS